MVNSEANNQTVNTKRAVIIGGGIAAVSAAVALRRYHFKGSIDLYSEEAYYPYKRYLLSKALYHKDIDLSLHDPTWYQQQQIRIHLKQKVIQIDTKQQQLVLENHRLVPYDDLIIAVGAHANRWKSLAGNSDNVLTLRTLQDAIKLSEFSKRNHRCIVVGGGILGLETAALLRDAHLEVTLIEQLPSLLAKHMDPSACELLYRHLKKEKIHVMVNTQIKQLHGTPHVEVAELTNGKFINTDFVVLTTGIQANLKLVKNTAINHDQFIHVDSYMRTNIPHIYACGDVAECNHIRPAHWDNALKQGEIAALSICNEKLAFDNMPRPLLFQHDQFSCFMAGNVRQGDQYIECLDEENNRYEKYAYENGLCSGALLINRESQISYAWNAFLNKTAYPLLEN